MLVLPALATPTVLKGHVPVGAVALAALSLGLFLWTLLHNKLGNFNIRPTPKSWGMLVTTGPYQQIRHPMYTSVMLGAASFASMSEPLLGWLAWTTLAAILLFKSTLEERWMSEVHPSYDSYRRESKRFIPWVF
jgi:protein-S-isoprenylcysteine O-methyltransferase Ste14